MGKTDEHRGRRYWIWVFGDVEGLRWVLESQRMAFAEHTMSRAAGIREGDQAILYITRGAFNNPPRDRARICGLATVGGPHKLRSVSIADRDFALLVPIETDLVTPEREGPLVKPLAEQLSFVKRPEVWGQYFRNSPLAVPEADYRVLEAALIKWHRDSGR